MGCLKSDKTNFCVETKGLCLFCFHESYYTCNKSPETDPVASYNISLRRLSKYLNLNFQNVFKLKIPLQHKKLGSSDIIVPLCGDCAILCRKFARLHHEFEVITMQMHACIQEISERILKSEKSPRVKEKYRQLWRINDPKDEIHAGIVDNLRKETKEKCLSRVKMSFPRVKLKKLITPENQHSRKIDPTKIAKIVPEKKVSNGPSNASTISQMVTKDGDEPRSKSIPKLPSNPAPQVQIYRSVPNFPKDTVVLKSSCKNATVQNASASTVTVKSTPGHHPETTVIGPTQLIPNSSKHSQHLPATPFSSTSTGGSVVVSDPPTQNSSTSLATGSGTRKTAGTQESGSSYECAYCEQKFSDKSTLRIHVVKSHYEHFFTTLKDRSLTANQFKTIVDSLFKNVAKSHTVRTESSSENSYSCPNCQVTMESDGDVYAHMFRFHYSELTSKLLFLQKEAVEASKKAFPVPSGNMEPMRPTEPAAPSLPSLMCKFCGLQYGSKRALSTHQKLNCKKIPSTKPASLSSSSPTYLNALSNTRMQATASNLQCAYCEKRFSWQWDNRIHVLTNHPIEEFSKYVSSGITSQQVDTELKQILHTFRKVPGNEDAGACVYCSETFSQVIKLQHHVLVSHFDVVVFKLRSLTPQNLPCSSSSNRMASDNPTTTATSAICITNASSSSSSSPSTHANFHGSVPDSRDPLFLSDPLSEDNMQDPLSLDFLDEPSGVLYKEEEQVKMEWLFSFFEDDVMEVDASQPQQLFGDQKAITFGDTESELIIP